MTFKVRFPGSVSVTFRSLAVILLAVVGTLGLKVRSNPSLGTGYTLSVWNIRNRRIKEFKAIICSMDSLRSTWAT